MVERLTALGLEVEGVENPAEALKDFRVATVIEATQHPNADRLRVCRVDAGDGEVQVVCGAPNARTGMKGVFAPPGAYIPGTDLLLKKGQIRGEDSHGMLLSERELGLSDDHEGIIDLPEDAPVGTPYADYAGLNDPVIDIAITPNRGDCLGVRGIARDLAAAGVGTLKPLDTEPVPGTFKSPMTWTVDLPGDQAHLAPIIGGRYFRGLKNGPSPKWMQDRLRAVGLRPISALVDITNYVMMDVGRPLHAYDAQKVDGGITVRLAKPGESYLALNGKEYTFDDTMLVLADDHGPDDMAGIMGGEKTGCSDDTTEMFLEVAIFDPTSVAATGRKLGSACIRMRGTGSSAGSTRRPLSGERKSPPSWFWRSAAAKRVNRCSLARNGLAAGDPAASLSHQGAVWCRRVRGGCDPHSGDAGLYGCWLRRGSLSVGPTVAERHRR